MAASTLPSAVVDLVRSLTALSDSQLAVLLSQQPQLAPVVSSMLHHIALANVDDPFALLATPAPRQGDHVVSAIVTILDRLIRRGDPSLARKFVPTPGSILDLALAAHLSIPGRTRAVLERLLDPFSTAELLDGLRAQLEASRPEQVAGTARILASFLAVCPLPALSESGNIITQLSVLLTKAYNVTLPAQGREDGDLSSDSLDSSPWKMQWLASRVHVLQAAGTLLHSVLAPTSPFNKQPEIKAAVLVAIATSPEAQSGSEPLLSASLFDDLLHALPLSSLIENAGAAVTDAKAQAVVASLPQHTRSERRFSGPAWTALSSLVRQNKRSGKGKAQAEGVDETLVATVTSVLPHYDAARLREVLSRPSFRGQSAEQVIQRLLEGDEGAPAPAPAPAAAAAAAAAYEPPPQIPRRGRANVFDDQPLDLSRVRVRDRGEGAGAGLESLSADLKAAIIARASAPSDDEEEEEWNPFATVTVGVEDELDSSSGSDTDTDTDADAGAGSDGDREGSGVEREREAERALIRHYAAYGATSLSRGAAGTPARRELAEQLGPGWDDALIDGWARMFDRNPRRDRLLSAAAGEALLSPHAPPPPPPPSRGTGRGRGRGGGRGNSRGAKERRGNQARKRGFDSKVARGNAGASF